MVQKRGYSTDFTPRTARRVTLMIDKIPPTMLDAAKARARREGISLRALVLGWLKAWAAGELAAPTPVVDDVATAKEPL